MADKSTKIQISLYPGEIDIVERYAQVLEPGNPNFSATIRAIIREWNICEGRKLAEMEKLND